MITGFGNNTASALASDITAGQTSFAVVPGSGVAFAKLLTTDMSNPSSPHQLYAKLTLTDSQQTVFEICHLTAVTNDTLTVIRGQEGTTAKGWALNDVIANFATRGSEQSFVQIEQLQGGDYTTAIAGGTPNALAISLPSTFQNNGTNDWLLKSPLSITPIAANSGAATLQITLGGKVIGTFPLYKGNKAELDSGDLLANVPFICVIDSTKAFFTVINPVKIYSKLGTAAYSDVQTSKDDVTPGRVLVNGSAIAVRSVNASGEAGGNVADANNLPTNSVSFVYASAAHSPGFESSILDFSGLGEVYNVQLAASYTHKGLVKLRTKNGDSGTWLDWTTFYTTDNKPTADDVGALPISGGEVTGPVTFKNNSANYPLILEGTSPTIALNETDTGKKILLVMDGSSIRLEEDSTSGREIWSWSTPQSTLSTAGSFSAAGGIHSAQSLTLGDVDSGLRAISDGVVSFLSNNIDIGYFSPAGIGLKPDHSFLIEAKESNAARFTNELLNINGQIMTAGIVADWYNGYLAFGCQRDASTGIAGFSVWQNGVLIFNANANGALITNTGAIASQSWVSGNYCTIPQRDAINAVLNSVVKDIRLNGRTGIGADGWSAAPDGAVFNGGGDFGSDNGSYSYTYVQKYTDNTGWVTVAQV
jgi:hypothetical protein